MRQTKTEAIFLLALTRVYMLEYPKTAKRQMKTILFIIDMLTGSRVHKLAGAREVCSQHGYHIEEIETSRIEDPLEKVVRYWAPAGCIIDDSGSNMSDTSAFADVPVVHLDPCEKVLLSPHDFTVSSDNRQIADLAVAELVKTGCKHFAFFGWNKQIGWSYRRQERFCELLKRMNRPFSVMDDTSAFYDKTMLATRSRPFLAALPRPCGIFAANDDFAATILDICTADGIRIPGDMFVVGVDDDPVVCDNLRPSLSSVRPGFVNAGRIAMSLLAKMIDNPHMPVEKKLYHPLGITSRLSTRHVVAQSKRVLSAIDLIRREACHGLKASDVVMAFGTSERQAEIEFKNATGKRITQEITDVRFEHVFELLMRPSQAIAPIANLCGWDSDIYLKRLFKQRMGMTMREWRAAHLDNPTKR